MPRESESRPALTEGRMRHGVKPTMTSESDPPPPPPPPPKRVMREDAPGAAAVRAFRERTVAWLRKYRIPVETNPYKVLLAKWDEEIKRRQLEDSTHSMGTSIAMQEMADELRAVIDASEED